jgi:hypothetical protein
MVKWRVLLALHEEFFGPALARLEKTFLGLCVHNVDPERTFNVVGAFLKTAPNAKEFCISQKKKSPLR